MSKKGGKNMKTKILPGVVITLMLATAVVPVLGGTANIGTAGQKQQTSTMGRAVNLTVAITTDWVNGWQDHGLRVREFPLDGKVWAYSEIAAPDLYGLYFTQVWWYDNGTGLENKWSWGWQITEHWTSSASWSWWQIGLDYGKGQGFIETLVDNVSVGISNYYAMGNTKPNAPTITGDTSGKIKQPHTYNLTATDPDGFNVSYFVDWGDNTTTDWTTFTPSGVTIQLTHTWTKKGDYTIKCKVKDRALNESAWTTLAVKMPYSNIIPRTPFLERLFERFPNAFPILQYLLGY
jgi:hypothetical protein